MGCLSSKEKSSEDSVRIKDKSPTLKREGSTKSRDSGIELSYPATSTENGSVSEKDSKAYKKNTVKPKGTAFNVAAASKGLIKKHPPRKAFDRAISSRGGERNRKSALPPLTKVRSGPPERLKKKPYRQSMEELKIKQEEADRRREADRLAVIARQRRRDLRAQKVIERKMQLQLSEEKTDDLSDVDTTFNVDDEFDWNETSTNEV